jgi:hypothetical protein
MAQIDDLYFATLTDSEGENPETDSPLNLVINDGNERLNARITGGPQSRRGEASLNRLNVRSRGIDSSRLRDGSIRVGVLGDDQWNPRLLFLWGQTPETRPNVGVIPRPSTIVPLAIRTEVAALSTDDAGAVPSIPLRTVSVGSPTMLIERLLLILQTEWDPDSEGLNLGGGTIFPPENLRHGATDDQIELEVVADDRVVFQRVITRPRADLQSSEVNIYTVPVAVPFSRVALRSDGVRLRITGADSWVPRSAFLFGLNTSEGRPGSIIPLVHLNGWELGRMSTDPGEGNEQVVLPLLPISQGASDSTVQELG